MTEKKPMLKKEVRRFRRRPAPDEKLEVTSEKEADRSPHVPEGGLRVSRPDRGERT
jgi:hypothetical protein